jgi:hypothetical protein
MRLPSAEPSYCGGIVITPKRPPCGSARPAARPTVAPTCRFNSRAQGMSNGSTAIRPPSDGYPFNRTEFPFDWPPRCQGVVTTRCVAASAVLSALSVDAMSRVEHRRGC